MNAISFRTMAFHPVRLIRFSSVAPVFHSSMSAATTDVFTTRTTPPGPFVLLTPQQSHVLVVPGLLSPQKTVNQLAQFLSSNGVDVTSKTNPYIFAGRSLEDAYEWELKYVNDERIRVVQAHLHMLRDIFSDPHKLVAMQKVLRQFSIDNPGLASIIYRLLFNPRFASTGQTLPNTIETLRSGSRRYKPDNPEQSISAAIKPFRTSLIEAIQQTGLIRQLNPKATSEVLKRLTEKTADKILDTIAPRLTLIGHSMGGVVCDSVNHNSSDVNTVFTFGSPFSGTEDVPPAIQDLEIWIAGLLRIKTTAPLYQNVIRPRLIKHIPQFLTAIESMRKVPIRKFHDQHCNNTVPNSDSTTISVTCDEDGLSTPAGAKPPQYAVHLIVPSVEVPISDFYMPENLLQSLYQKIPLLKRVLSVIDGTDLMDKSDVFKGFRYHLGVIANPAEQAKAIYKTLFSDPQKLAEILDSHNYDQIRSQVIQTLGNPQFMSHILGEDYQTQYPLMLQQLKPLIERIAEERLPFADSVDKHAKSLLRTIQRSTLSLTKT